jgi:phospholipid/cholesterol/gamma-HCH transport system substrate-binding protein
MSEQRERPGLMRLRQIMSARGPRFIGSITIAVVLVLVAALFAPSGFALGRVTYHAQLKEAGGLAPGDEVRIAGVDVGRVKSLKVVHALVKVDFRIDRGLHLGSDTTAEVKVATLLGNHYLALRPAGGGALAGRTIPVANTLVPFEVQDIVAAGGAALEQLDGAKLRDALRVLSDDFRNTPALTGKAFDSIARLSDVIVNRRRELDTLVKQANAVTTTLDGNRDVLVDLMRQAGLVLGEVAKRRAAITALLSESKALADQLVGVVRDNRAVIAPMLDHLNVVLGTLRADAAALNQIAILLGPAARYFANAGGNGPYLDVNGPNAIFPDSMLCLPQGKCVPNPGPKK